MRTEYFKILLSQAIQFLTFSGPKKQHTMSSLSQNIFVTVGTTLFDELIHAALDEEVIKVA